LVEWEDSQGKLQTTKQAHEGKQHDTIFLCVRASKVGEIEANAKENED